MTKNRPRGKRAPGLHVHGTPRDLAAHDKGYSGDGTGEWSRHAAHFSPQLKHSATVAEPVEMGRNSGELIRDETREIEKLKERWRASSIESRGKIEKKIGIKLRFIAKLKSEQQSEMETTPCHAIH